MGRTIRWGILGPGKIAHKFAEGLQSAKDSQLVAVGSRDRKRADEFADKFSVPRRHGSYEDLAADTEVDVIYVATPHTQHKDSALLCLNAGKAVLCEKPFTINARQAREVIGVAKRKKVFLMEAMWSRFLPHVGKLRELLEQKAIGEVRMIQADFGFRAGVNPESRLFNPSLGGGGLLDVGIYPVSLATMILGAPNRVRALAEIGTTGVDDQAVMILGYPGGQLALLATGVRTSTLHEATVLGTEGYLRIARPWWRPSSLVLGKAGKEEKIEVPAVGNGYNYEADEVVRCLQEGRTQSPTMPLAETVRVLKILDRIRAQWGLKYPME